MAWSAPTLLSSGSGTVSATSQTITGVTASIGDLVIVSGAAFTATAAASITMSDSAGNTYTPCVRTKTNANNVNCWIFFSVLTSALAGGTITVTGTNNLINWRMGAVSFTGQAASPEDTACRASLNSGGTTSPTVTSGVPTASGDLMIGAMAGTNGSAVTYTEDATWTNLFNGSTPQVAPWGFAYQINPGSGARTYNPTIGTSVNTTNLITGFKVGGAAAISGSLALQEVQDSLVAAGNTEVSGAAALLEVQDSLVASGTVVGVSISGSLALQEVQDSFAATGALSISGSLALQEIQDSFAATGTVTLPAISGSLALQEIQDSFAAQGNNGIIVLQDGNDPGLKKRRKAEEERRRKNWEDEKQERDRLRALVVNAFERVIEGKQEITPAVADDLVAVVEREHAREPRHAPDFTEVLASSERLQAMWDAYLDRDDEEVLALL